MEEKLKVIQKVKKNILRNPKLINYYSTINRLMDSLIVLFGVALFTFIIVRINLKISSVQPISFIAFGLLSLLIWKISFIKEKLYFVGLLAASILLFTPLSDFLPSLKESPENSFEFTWRSFFIPCFWLLIVIGYSLRSFFSEAKPLLSFIGFFVLTFYFISSTSSIFHKLNLDWVIPIKPALIIKAGDPLADLRLNPSIHPDALKKEEKRLGLDKPLYKQFLLWLDGIIVKGEFGLTQQGEPVIDAIKYPLRNTLLLNVLVLFFTWILSIPLGVLASVNHNKWLDKLILNYSSLSITTPAFLLTIFVLALSVKLGVGQIGGITSVNYSEMNFIGKVTDIASHLILPVTIMTFVSMGGLVRQMRGNLLDVLNEDYIKAARARGIPEIKIFWDHALKNAINPLVTLLGFEFAALVSGAALTEMILAYPGLGALTLEAAKKLDINLIMFNLLLGTIMLMLGNVFADWLLRRVDPRVITQN